MTPHERDLFRIDITPAMITAALRRPDNFGLSSSAPHSSEIGRTWAMGPIIDTRDSTLLDRCNRIALIRYLESLPELTDDWHVIGANHWACGWVDHLSYRVIDADGAPSRMMREIVLWTHALASYCVADELLLSKMESAAESENLPQILSEVRRCLLPHLSVSEERLTDTVLSYLLRRHRIEGECEDGWRRYSRWEIKELARHAIAFFAARKRSHLSSRRARKLRRGW